MNILMFQFGYMKLQVGQNYTKMIIRNDDRNNNYKKFNIHNKCK